MHQSHSTSGRVVAVRARSSIILAASILAISTPQALPASWSWLGNTGNWTDPLQWSDDSMNSTAPVSAETTDLIFGGIGAVSYTATNDVAGSFLLNTLSLNSSATVAQMITGNPLDFHLHDTSAQIIQHGAGAFVIGNSIILSAPLTLGGAGTGLTTFNGVLSGPGSLTVTSGNWQLSNTGNSWTGGTTLTGGLLHLNPAAGQHVNIGAGTNSLIGNAAEILINGGELKVTTTGAGVIQDTNNAVRPITFGSNGGVLTLDGRIKSNGSSSFSFTVNSTEGNPGIVRFNGGAVGLSDASETNGNWNVNGNTLRISALSGSGPLRIEVTNGAMYRHSIGTTNLPLTVRGVVGGDPTSGPDASVNAGLSRTLGRLAIDTTAVFSQGLRLEGAIQIHGPNAARVIDGNIVVAGSSSGAAGYVVFNGRSTGTNLGSDSASVVNDPGASGVGQNVLWIGRNQNDTLTIENGGIAVFDLRVRYEQGNHNGVLLDGRAVIQGGGTLRLAQSISNFSFDPTGIASPNTTANVGDHIIRGDIEGQGTTTNEAVIDIALPAPKPTASPGVPQILTMAPSSPRDFGGVRFEDTTGNADFIVNGTGFGGLRINGVPRPNALFSGGIDDPVSTLTKINDALPASRLSRVSGTGGYLTIAPQGETYTFPAGGEWSDPDVGLKVVNHNPSGVDVSLELLTSWSKNLALDGGAEIITGASPLTLSSASLHGSGTISGPGGVVLDSNSTLSPGLDGIGTLNVGDITLDGLFALDATNTPSIDLLNAANLTLGPNSILSINPGSNFNNETYTFATYSGSLTGTFANVVGLPLGFSVSYATPNQLQLVFNTVQSLIWRGTPGSVWSTDPGDNNWIGDASFSDGDGVTFDDVVGAGSNTVNVSGIVKPGAITFNNSSVDYTVVGSEGNVIGGGTRLVKNGTGTLSISGPHTYAGGTDINEGTLRLAASDTLPDFGTVTVADGAILDVNGQSDAIASLVVNGDTTAGNLTVGSLTIGGGGTMATNFVLNGDVVTTSSANATISGAVDLGGSDRTFRIEPNSSPELTISGVVSNGDLTKIGAGTLALTHSSSSIGTLTIVTGTVSTEGSSLTVKSLAGTGTMALGDGGSITIDQDINATFEGTITGSNATVTKEGSGILRLTTNNFTGNLVISEGVVSVMSATAAGTSDITVNSGGSLDVATTINNTIKLNGGLLGATGGSTLIQGDVHVLAASVLRNADPENLANENELDIRGALQGTGDLFVQTNDGDGSADNGPGIRLRGTGVSNYSGTITVANATKFELQTSVTGPFSPAGTAKIRFNAGTITGNLNGTYSELNLRNNSSGNSILGNDIEILGEGLVNFGPLGNAPSTSRIILGNLRIGEDQIAAANRNGTAGVPSFAVEFQSVTLTGGNATFSPTTAGMGFSSLTDMALGPIDEDEAGSGIVMDGQNVLFLEGENTYTGPTIIQRGTVRLGHSAALPMTTELRLTGGTLNLSHPSLGSFDQTIAALSGTAGTITNSDSNLRTLTVDQDSDTVFEGSITGNIALVKDGEGTLVLEGANTYIGTTTVNDGTLQVDGGLVGDVFVEGGTLGGSGVVGDVEVNAGTLAPGSSPGALTTGNLTLNDSSALSIELNGLTAGTGYDQVNVVGTVEIGASVTLSLSLGAFEPVESDVFTIILNDGVDDVARTFAGLPNGTVFSVGSHLFQISYFDDALTPEFELTGGNDVSLIVVPEPGAMTSLLAGLALVAGVRRRRR